VAHGTERVVDDIREYAYQISVMPTTVHLLNIYYLCWKFYISYFLGSQMLKLCRHLPTSNILILQGEIKVAMCVRNLRALSV
jgi:hypothetical protein